MPLRSIYPKGYVPEEYEPRTLEDMKALVAQRKETRQGLSSLPGQAAWMAGLMLPTSGGTDYFGMYPEMPRGEGITGETMPSFAENIRNKRYLDAFYQGLGLTGDLAMGAGAVYKPALALGAGMKVISGMGKAAKTKEQARMASKINPRYFVNEVGGVPNADFLRLKLPKSYNTTVEARYVETPDGRIIMAPKITTPTGGVVLALDPGSLIYRDLDQAKTGLIDFALADDSLKLGHPTRSEAREKTLSKLREKLESERNASVLPDETGIIDENFDFIPFTEKPLLDHELSLKGELPKMTRESIDEMYAQQTGWYSGLMADAAARKRGVPVSKIHAEAKAENVPFEISTPQEIDVFAKADQLGAKADDLLEWQKPLTEQQPAVQEKIKNLIGEDFFNKAAADGLTGEDVYRNFEEVMLNDDLAQYGLEFLKPKLSTEKLGPGAYFNEAGIKGIVYGPESVDVFDPLKYKKVESGAKLPESLQPPKKPVGLTNKKITARQLISGRIDPDFYAKNELMEAAGSILVKQKPHKYSTRTREVQKLAPWVFQKRGTKRDGVLGLKDYDEIIEIFHQADPTWAAQLDEAYKVRLDVDRPGLTPEQLINKWIKNDDLIPSQVDEVFEYNRTLEYQDEVIETLESKGYNPEGMTEDELSSVLEKINSDPESVEVDVFVDVEEDALPPFNRGGPVTQPLYSDKRYLF